MQDMRLKRGTCYSNSVCLPLCLSYSRDTRVKLLRRLSMSLKCSHQYILCS